MKSTIRKRLMLSFAVIVAAMVLCQLGFNAFLAKRAFVYERSRALESSFAQIKKDYTNDSLTMATMVEEIQDQYGIKIRISNDEGVVYSNQKMDKEIFGQQLQGGNSPGLREPEMTYSTKPKAELMGDERTGRDGMEMLGLGGKFRYQGQTIYVMMTLPMESIDSSVAVFGKYEVLISFIALVAAFGLAILLARNFTEPIENIEKVSRNLAKADFSERADEAVKLEELSSLATSINTMSDRLEENMTALQSANAQLQVDIDARKQIEQMRKEFIAGVSHEMKTPLSVLQIYAEMLKSQGSEIDADYYCDTILEETEKLDEMVKKMLEFSSLDCGFTRLECRNFDLSGLLEEIVRQYAPLVEGFQFTSQIRPGVELYGDPKYLEQAVKNLLNNALQYAEVGKRIALTMQADGNRVEVRVYNDGAPLSEATLEHLWEAFYRDDRARTRTEKNHIGMGLYIVKTVVAKHGGECRAENRRDGVEFVISLPQSKTMSQA